MAGRLTSFSPRVDYILLGIKNYCVDVNLICCKVCDLGQIVNTAVEL